MTGISDMRRHSLFKSLSIYLVLQGDKIRIQVARQLGQPVGVIEVATFAVDLIRGATPPQGRKEKRLLGGQNV